MGTYGLLAVGWLQLMEECLHLEAKSCPPGSQEYGGSRAEERGENLVSCVRNLPGLATMLSSCVTRQCDVSASRVLQCVLRHYVTVNACLFHQSKWIKCTKCLKNASGCVPSSSPSRRLWPGTACIIPGLWSVLGCTAKS